MTVFLTFGDASFERSLQRIEREAAASGFFDVVEIKRPRDLGRTFWRKHGRFVRGNRRGYGYWIWKPWLILEALRACRAGEMLVYADAGSTINAAARRRFDDYCGALEQSPLGVVGFQMGALQERRFTKGDAFEALDAWHLRDTGQAIATMILWRACPGSIRLAEEWLALCETYALISDAPSAAPNDPTFIEHRHDQSLFSLLSKQHGATLIDDETYFSNWASALGSPFWATRFRDPRPKKKRVRLSAGWLPMSG